MTLNIGTMTPEAVTTFVRGCMSRERERLARIIETTSDPKELAAAIRDSSLDAQVFE